MTNLARESDETVEGSTRNDGGGNCGQARMLGELSESGIETGIEETQGRASGKVSRFDDSSGEGDARTTESAGSDSADDGEREVR